MELKNTQPARKNIQLEATNIQLEAENTESGGLITKLEAENTRLKGESASCDRFDLNLGRGYAQLEREKVERGV